MLIFNITKYKYIQTNYTIIQIYTMPRYVSSAKVREVYDIHPETLRGWALKGAINARAIQNTGGRRTWLYDLESIGTRMDIKNDQPVSSSNQDQQRPTIIYCRVSSSKQIQDLDRQKQLLTGAYPDSQVITDIGSGINYNKPGLSKLVELVCREQISRIVVSFKDRLLRFGYELFAQMCKEHNVQIVVFTDQLDSTNESVEFETEELQEDLLSIVNVFIARRNGKKAGILRRLRKEQAEQSDQDQTVSKFKSKDTLEQDV